MAFVQMVTVPGMTADQYDKVMELAYGGDLSDGEIFHVAGQNDAGWWVIDGWDSREQCVASSQKLMPALEEVGISLNEPPQEFEIHNVMVRG
jgi:hypothetical protein